jgi:hypothetical protein
MSRPGAEQEKKIKGAKLNNVTGEDFLSETLF